MKKKTCNGVSHLAAAFATSLALLVSSAGALAGEYRLRQAEPDLGSNIRRSIGVTSIPLDRGYAELTADEVADLRATYQSLPAGDEPPFPAHGLGRLTDAVSRLQRQMQLTGKLSVVVRVDATGVAQAVSVIESPNDDLQGVVGGVLMNAAYKPGMHDGKPCPMDLPITLRLIR